MRRRQLPDLARAWVHLMVLWGFAFAKPLFDVLADSPDFFVARGNTAADIVLLAVALVLVPPTALVLVEALALRAARVREALHVVIVLVLASAFAVQSLDGALGGSTAAVLVAGALAGLGFVAAYVRVPAVRQALTVLGPAPLAFLLLFTLTSPVSDLILPRDERRAATADVASRTPVVMVVFDEFDATVLMDRRGRIDRSRYPNLAGLADRATWYRNATTVADRTGHAVPALVSGRPPPPGALAVSNDYPNTIFTLLADSHEQHVVEVATQLCPERVCGAREREPAPTRLRSLVSDLTVVSLHLLLPDALRTRLPAIDQTFGNFREGGRDADAADPEQAPDGPEVFLVDRPRTFDRFVRAIAPTRGRPGFHFLHIALPHAPWQYLPSGQQYPQSGPAVPGLRDDTWGDDLTPVRLALQRHALQAGYADRLVGRVVARLRAARLYDDALLVVTADHGVSYRPGLPRRTVTRETASDIASVPLLVKSPRQRSGEVDDAPARTIDIVPTVADRLGVELPWRAAGRALGGARRRPGAAVRVATGSSGDVIGLAFTAFVRSRDAARARLASLLGSRNGVRGLYAMGAVPGLIGRRVTDVGTRDQPGAGLKLDAPQIFDDVDPGGSTVPALVTATLLGRVGERAKLAVAVNGRVRAVTSSFRDRGRLRLAAMVSPGSFVRGPNRIDAFVVTGDDASPTLLRLATERPPRYRIDEENGQVVIAGEGRRRPVRAGRVRGYVDAVSRAGDGVHVSGWAVDARSGRAADRIVVFAGTTFAVEGRPSVARPDVASDGSRRGSTPGFRLGPLSTATDLSTVRVFALAGDGASELPRP